MNRLRLSKNRALLTAALVVMGLVASVAVARASTPAITDATVPPGGHFGAACSSCHVVEPGGTVISPVVVLPGDRDDQGEELAESDETSGAIEVDDQQGEDEQSGEDSDSEAVSGHQSSYDDQGEDADDADEADESDDHETLDEGTHERDHDEDSADSDVDDEGDDSSD